MADTVHIKKSTLRLVKGDITDMDVEAFVYYARNDLALGSGFGSAISVRGGASIEEELKQFGSIETTAAVVTSAGNMKAGYIIHAAGPKFQEADLENKLYETVVNSLRKADERGIRQVALPPMGTGFYGVPLALSANITIDAVSEYLSGSTEIEEVIICLLDNREHRSFQEYLTACETIEKEGT